MCLRKYIAWNHSSTSMSLSCMYFFKMIANSIHCISPVRYRVFSTSTDMILVFEYAGGGDLSQLVTAENGTRKRTL